MTITQRIWNMSFMLMLFYGTSKTVLGKKMYLKQFKKKSLSLFSNKSFTFLFNRYIFDSIIKILVYIFSFLILFGSSKNIFVKF